MRLILFAVSLIFLFPPAARAQEKGKTSQVVFAVSESWQSTDGKLSAIAFRENAWKIAFRDIPVTFGRAGTGIGIGLHSKKPSGPGKREGDKRAPAGVFPLEFSFGTVPESHHGTTGMRYERTSPTHFWVDDPESRFYNQWVDTASPRIEKDWNSAEILRRKDGLYDLVIVVGHNRRSPVVRGGGSAIFMHRWLAPGRPTIGCTAMAAEDLSRLWKWLDAKKSPVLIQGPADFVRQLDLPPVPEGLLAEILRP